MKPIRASLLLVLSLTPLPAAAAGGPAQLCPHIVRTFARKAELPAGALALLPPMAERGGRFLVTDVIGPGQERLPATRFISARQTGCTLSINYEYGGIAHGFATARLELRGRVWMLERRR